MRLSNKFEKKKIPQRLLRKLSQKARGRDCGSDKFYENQKNNNILEAIFCEFFESFGGKGYAF